MNWHLQSPQLDMYATGELDAATAFSIEAHLATCEDCSAKASRYVDPERTHSVWAGIESELDIGYETRVERALRWLGLNESSARLLAATPSLRLAWLGSICVTLLFAVVASRLANLGPWPLLLIAPILPVAGVAVAYGPHGDPAYEIGVASPMSGFKLLVLRSSAVLVTTIALGFGASVLLREIQWTTIVWLAPALCLTCAVLALSTAVPPSTAGRVVGGVWAASVLVANRVEFVWLAITGPTGQAVFLMASLSLFGIFAMRRGQLERGIYV